MPNNHDVISVVVINDHRSISQALSAIVSAEEDMQIEERAHTKNEVFEALDRHDPDVAVVNTSVAGVGGLQLVRLLRETRPDVSVLVLSTYNAPSFAKRSLQAGALGHVSTSESNAKMVAAIRSVASGDVYLDQRVMGRVLKRLAEKKSHPIRIESLTPREFTVFELLGNDASTSQIAESLDVKAATVRKYERVIREKLGVDSHASLTNAARRWASDRSNGHVDRPSIQETS